MLDNSKKRLQNRNSSIKNPMWIEARGFSMEFSWTICYQTTSGLAVAFCRSKGWKIESTTTPDHKTMGWLISHQRIREEINHTIAQWLLEGPPKKRWKIEAFETDDDVLVIKRTKSGKNWTQLSKNALRRGWLYGVHGAKAIYRGCHEVSDLVWCQSPLFTPSRNEWKSCSDVRLKCMQRLGVPFQKGCVTIGSYLDQKMQKWALSFLGRCRV